MNNKLEEAQDKFIAHIGELCNSFGLNKFVAQLYGVLYLNSNKEMSLDQITESLRGSKGNVSISVRILENWGMVSKVWVKGSRKNYYKANPDIEKIFFEKIKSAIRKRLEEISVMIEEFRGIITSGQDTFSREDVEKANIYLEKLKKVEHIRNNTRKFLDITEEILLPR